jgi:hypothetical protein
MIDGLLLTLRIVSAYQAGKIKFMSKHKFFAWLIFHDRINTRDMLLRRRWDVSGDHNYVYVHAKLWRIGLTYFLSATLALEPRNYLQISWGSDSDPEMLQRAKKLFSGPCFFFQCAPSFFSLVDVVLSPGYWCMQ